jgi:hypothetical protein
LDLKITDLSKVALFPGTHKTKTEQAEEVEVFNDQKSVILSSFSSFLNLVTQKFSNLYLLISANISSKFGVTLKQDGIAESY